MSKSVVKKKKEGRPKGDRQDRGVHIDVGKRAHRLKYDYNALVELEEATDRPISDFQTGMEVKNGKPVEIKKGKLGYVPFERRLRFSLKLTKAMFWAGLLHEIPDLTIDEAAYMLRQVPGNGIVEKWSHATEKCMEAFGAALKGDPDEPKIPTSETSEAAPGPVIDSEGN